MEKVYGSEGSFTHSIHTNRRFLTTYMTMQVYFVVGLNKRQICFIGFR